jgi:hypothetical protein
MGTPNDSSKHNNFGMSHILDDWLVTWKMAHTHAGSFGSDATGPNHRGQ